MYSGLYVNEQIWESERVIGEKGSIGKIDARIINIHKILVRFINFSVSNVTG